MTTKSNSLKVGAVTLLSVAGALAILLWISQHVSGSMQSITIRFRSTSGMPTLAAGSDVLVGGQKVGKVVHTELRKEPAPNPGKGDATDAYFVVVAADIRDVLELRADCKVFAEGPPLGGDGVVKIDLGSSAQKWPAGKVLEGSEPGGFGAVLAALQSEFDGANPKSLLGQIKSQLDPAAEVSIVAKLLQSVRDINALTASLSRELGTQDRAALLMKVHQIVDNINETTAVLRTQFEGDRSDAMLGKVLAALDSMNGGLATATRILRNNEGTIDDTFKNVETASERIAAELDPQRLDSLLAHFKAAGQRLNKSLEDINTVTSTTRDVVVLNRENVNRLLVNFKESSDHLKTGVKYVLRHPWRLLNEPSPAAVKQQAIFDAARCFADAASKIDDTSAQLRALAELHDGNIPATNPDLQRIQAELKETRDKYQKAEAELWRALGVE